MKTDHPLLISKPGAAFEMSLPEAEIEELIRSGDLTAIFVRGQHLVVYESLLTLIRRKRRQVISV
jgi:hypothetical protein